MAKNTLELLAESKNKTYLEMALENFEMWYNANQALSLNKDYEINNGQNSKRRLSRADADEVMMMMKYWDNEVQRAQGTSNSGAKIKRIFTVSSNA